MSRSVTRIPPIRVAETFFTGVADMDDASVVCIMRIAGHHVRTGRPMTIAEFERGTDQSGLFLHALLRGVSHLLDPDAMRNGDLVVIHVADGLAHRDEIAAKRSEAANVRYLRAAAEQKATGGEIKLTKGRMAGRGKGAAASPKEDASDSSTCTHVHKTDDYAHMCMSDACTHVHKEENYAHVCINDGCTHVHKTALDAHMCMSDRRDSAEEYAHMCITSAHDFPEMAENMDFQAVDNDGEPRHASVRPTRADLSISNNSLESDKRVESARRRARYDEAEPSSRAQEGMGGRRKASSTHKAVATSNLFTGSKHGGFEHLGDASHPPYRPSAGSSRSGSEPSPVPPEFVSRLVEAGPVDADAARQKLSGWIERWGVDFVRSGIEAIPDKDIARPLSYLSSILTNLAKEAGDARPPVRRPAGGPQETAEPVHAARMPRKVKRRVSVAPGASWQLLGWTAKGYEGDTPTMRKQVWRTESGDLRYLDGPPSEQVPTYQEDPGVYAYD